MKRQFILDKEIVLNDQTDLLKTAAYAKNLTEIIQNAPNGGVFTIGLFGSWGSGKSSIIETTKNNLVTNKGSKVKFITYDAWKYVNDSFRRMFLFEIQKGFGFQRTSLMEKFYQNNSQDIDIKNKISPLKIFGVIAALIIVVILVQCFAESVDTKVSIYSIIALVGILTGILTGAFNQLKVSVLKPHIFAPEQFEECFKEMIEEMLRPKGLRRVLHFIHPNANRQRKNQIIIVIDNIDRCNNEQAYNLLTDIKTFLSREPYNIIFIIPVDDEALRKHILSFAKNTEDDCAKEKEEFLRKFFNVTIRIKPHQTTEMYEFAKRLNDKYNLGFSNVTINVASKEYARNPRRVIQLFNNLSAELNNFDADFAIKYETLICKMLIIREEYNAYYQAILQDYSLFEKGIAPQQLEQNIELKRLLDDTRSYTSNCNSFVVSKILTNTNNLFADIPLKIREIIDSHNVAEAIKELPIWLTDDTSKLDRLVSYCIYNIERTIKHQLWNTEFKAYFEFIATINPTVKFLYNDNIRFEEKFKISLKQVIPVLKNAEQIVIYARYLQDQNLKYLTDSIISFLTKNDRSVDVWNDYFQGCMKYYDDAVTLKSLSGLFTKVYETDHFSLNELDAFKLKYVVTEDLLSHAIEQWPDLDEENIYIRDVIFASQNLTFSKDIVTKIYEKILSILGDLRGESHDGILNSLKVINAITENLSLNNDLSLIQNLINIIISARKIPHSSYPSHRSYDRFVSFVNECQDENEIETVVKFGVIAYKVSSGRISITDILDLFFDKAPDLVLKQILWLKDKWNFNLYPLAAYMLKFETYGNSNLMEIFAKHFTSKHNNKYVLSEESIRTKLDAMLDFAVQSSNTSIFDWLNTMSLKNERIKAMLISIISEKTIADIQALPKDLMNLAINSINKANIESYKKYPAFLAYLAEHGSAQQKSYLVGMFSDMLEKRDDMNSVLDIILSFKSLKQSDCNLLITQVQRITEEQGDLVDDNKYSTVINHLSSLPQSPSRKNPHSIKKIA
ncbi:MAG: KAP family NTPase [Alistipes sp.]|nr:KAP family NTPase [Alistipes senegalensis]MCM1250460.1 KAP family NTPase [Alistipes sp.]